MLYILGERGSGSKFYFVLLNEELCEISSWELVSIIKAKNIDIVYVMSSEDCMPREFASSELIGSNGLIRLRDTELLDIIMAKYMYSTTWGTYNDCSIGGVDCYSIFTGRGHMKLLYFKELCRGKQTYCTYTYDWNKYRSELDFDRVFLHFYDSVNDSDSGIVSFNKNGELSIVDVALNDMVEKLESKNLISIPYFDLNDKSLKNSKSLCKRTLKIDRLEFLFALNGLGHLSAGRQTTINILPLKEGGYKMNSVGDSWLIEYRCGSINIQSGS